MQLAQYGTRKLPAGRLRAVLATLEARCHAVLGNLPEVTQSVNAAQNALEASEGEPCPSWVSWFDAAEHNVTVGVCELIAAKHDPARAQEAISVIRAGTAMRPVERTRSRAFDGIALARAHVRVGELLEADHATATALALFGHVTSSRVTDRLEELDQELAAQPHARQAGETRERIKAAVAA